MATKKFKCTVCGYIHEGDKAPESCPVCKAPASEFVELKADKKGLSTNSNAYTLIYATVMVVIVAFLLSFVSSSLKEKQTENVRLDKMKQILSSLRVNIDSVDAKAEFAKVVKADMIISADGSKVSDKGGFEIASENMTADQLPLYVCEVGGATKYVVPLYGAGLWGPIWGYIAIDDDMNTVFGVYFSHASETPGLGAEITNVKFKSQFAGKRVYSDGQVGINVVKHGKADKTNSFDIDGVSGGTITSTGVNDMLKDCLGNYRNYFNAKQ